LKRNRPPRNIKSGQSTTTFQ